MLTKRVLLLALLAVGFLIPASAQTNVFNCTSFTTSGTCGAVHSGSTGGSFISRNGGYPTLVTNGVLDFISADSTHNGYGLWYYNQQNIQAFTTSFTWIPNGQNFAFVVQNTNNNPGYQGTSFASGAGCEGGFYQTFSGSLYPNNLFALEFEGDAYNNPNDSAFTYSTVQIYMSGQSPCSPNDTGGNFWPTTKFSTSPVSLNSPSNAAGKTTGDTYSATVTYDGSNLTVKFYDVTLGNSCPGANCYTHTWSNVRIPSLVGATTGLIGFTGGINLPNLPQESLLNWAYTVNTPTATPTSAPPAAGGNPASNPTFSPAAGVYGGTQSVTLSSATSGASICYVLAPAGLVVTPLPDNFGNCAVGTLYSGPVTVASSQTLYAITGTNATGLPSGVAQAPYVIVQGGGAPQVATPTFSPAAGTYSSAQSVTLSDATSGATIYYTTNGSTPTTSSPSYSGPITVSATETLQAMATANGDTNSAVASAGYTINVPVVATPTFSPAAGTYSSAQSVTLSDATSGATIYYTTNGSTPTTSSASYSGAITVSATESLQAMAAASGDTNSAVTYATYTISAPVVATPTFSPAAGTYSSAQSVSLSDATSGATIYYTTNGSTPTTSSTLYTGPITVSATETLQAMAAASGDTNSAVASAAYTINMPVVATPTFSPAAGTYSSAQSVSLSDATSGATIYYTTNGSTPTTSSTQYAGAIAVSSSETLKAMAAATGDTNSGVASAGYTINIPVVATPTFSPAAGTYSTAQTVALSDATPGATIYYTTNGSTPTTSSTQYTGAITVSSSETLQAIAAATGDTNSGVASAGYTINIPVVATPTFSPAAGTYSTAQTVALSDATPGAAIYYTTNGSTPTTSSTQYTGAITVSSSETLQAIAAATGDTNSGVASAAYTINATVVATPTFTPAAGTYTSAQSVTLADATSNATIYYTTNGSTPTTSSTPYAGAITVSSSETLQAIAVATGDTNSGVASAAYTINAAVVATPTFTPAAGTYTSAQSVTLSDTTSNATIYYTTNGSTPTTSSTPYAGAITVSSSETLQAMAVATGDTNSGVASAAYTINAAVVATPTFTPAAGTYTSAQSVTLADATSNATIYYTTNGSTPTTSSITYLGPFTVSTTRTLKAMAVATGATNSTVASAGYTISAQPVAATPTFSLAAGTYSSAQSVALSDATSGATIYYTTDGSTPTPSSTSYSGPITVTSTETLEAIAVATGATNSTVASATYTIAAAVQATNFAIGATVQQSAVKHLGINLGGQNFYDSGQLSRNLTMRNPGFEAEIWSSLLNCQAATATTCTDSDPKTVWAANFLQGASFQVLYGAAKGQTGTITGNTVSNAGANTGITVTFSAPLSPAPASGDVVQVQMQVPGNPQAGWWVAPSGGATFSADTTDLSPETPGNQALSINAAASGQSALVSSYFDSSAGRSFVQLNGTYTVTFRAKAVSGNNQINVSVARVTAAHGNQTYLNQNVSLTNQWQDYSYTFNVAEDGTYIGTAGLTFSIAGAQVYLDDVALTEPAAANNPTAFRNAVVATLRTLQPGVLRYMDGGADFASTTDNMIAVPFARLRAGYSEVFKEQDDISIGLHDFLVLCQTVGAEPWYAVPAGISPADMQNLIQYLAGNASTTYGAIRASLGQSAPWTSVFPIIHLELGNEVWNSGTFPGEAVPNPAAYGSMAATAFAAARASASYNPGNFDLVLGSWATQPSWTSQELTNSSGYDSVDVAPYLFNSLNDYGSNEAIFGPMFAQPEQVDSSPTASGNYMYQQAQAAAAGSTPAKLAVYEVNLSTTSGSAPQNVVNQAAAGLGAGIAVADHMLLMMRDLGITTQNMFALSDYSNAFTNSQGGTETVPLWGSVIDMGGETNLKRPQFVAEQLANNAILPTMLATTVSGANPTWNQPASTNDSIQLANAHNLQSFAFTDGTRHSVVVFNLSRSGSLPVTFSGSNAPSGNVVISQLTSANPTDNNEGLSTNYPVVASPTQTSANNFNPTTPYSLPPYSMTVLSWPGAGLSATTTLLQATPASANSGQTVTLTATVSSSGSSMPTGSVTFMNGSTTLGTGTLNASGAATLTTTTLPIGADSITAAYGGDASDAASTSAAVTVTITSGTVSSTTALAASATAITSGQSVTFTATVSPVSGTNVPTGTVTFKAGGKSLGTAKLQTGVATFSTTGLATGTQSIVASYGGDGKDYGSISSAVSVVVTAGTTVATRTTLSASASQIAIGQSVTFTATVGPQSGSTPATGSVTFLDGTTSLGTAQLNGSGVATFSTTSLPAGTQSITASYAGDTSNAASVSAAVSVAVTGGTVASSTTLSTSASQSTYGQSVTFTATVAPQSGSNVPTGTITFKVGSTRLGTAKLNGGGVATFSTTGLPVGTDAIVASYGGDGKDYGSISPAVSVTVVRSLNTPASSTALSASATDLTPGQSVTFTATVATQAGSTATGTVTFLDGTTTLGSGSLNSSDVATFSTTTLAAGTHSIVASYAGDSNDGGSFSEPVTVTVTALQQGLAATSTTVTASSDALLPTDSVTFTATVAPQTGSGVATGTVAFYDGTNSFGGAQLNASGVATVTVASLSLGAHSITAVYSGDANNAPSTSAVLIVSVSGAEYAMVVSANSVSLAPGQPSSLLVTLIPENGFNLPINLACSGLPSGTTCTFTPATVTPNGAPAMSTVTLMSAMASGSARNKAPMGHFGSGLAFGWVMPWGFIPLLGWSRKRRRSRFARWSFRLSVAAALTAGSLWVSGCGYTANTGHYVVTLTSSTSNAQTHSSQIAVTLQQ